MADKACEEMIAPAVDKAEETGAEVQEDEVKPEEETEKIRVAPAQCRPCEAEVEEHRISHMPFRSWCQECVMGRGLGEQRGRTQGRAHEIPRVGIDYWFITADGLTKRPQREYPLNAQGDELLEKARKEVLSETRAYVDARRGWIRSE